MNFLTVGLLNTDKSQYHAIAPSEMRKTACPRLTCGLCKAHIVIVLSWMLDAEDRRKDDNSLARSPANTPSE